MHTQKRIKKTATVFLNNKNQAIRLPKSIEFAESVKQVEITKEGDSLVITPIYEQTDTWDKFFDEVKLSEDFMKEREQPDLIFKEL